jgi:hypothetical protein
MADATYGGPRPDPPPVIKPGVIPLRPLAVGEVLDGAIATVRAHARALLGVALVAACGQQLLRVAVYALFGDIAEISGLPRNFDITVNSNDPFAGLRTTASPAYWITTIIGLLLSAVLTVVVAAIVADAVLGRRPTIAEVIRRLAPRWWPLLIVSILAGLLPVVGLVACIIPGVWLWGVFTCAIPAAVLEKAGPLTALRRSFTLARSGWWRTFGTRVLSRLIATLLTGVIGAPVVVIGLVALASNSGSGDGIRLFLAFVNVALAIVTGAVIQPLLAAVDTVLYIDRRMRSEGLDIELSRAAAGPSATA